MAESGIQDTARLLRLGADRLEVDELDYLEVLDAETLEPLEVLDRPARAFVAARVGRTRLIDNWAL